MDTKEIKFILENYRLDEYGQVKHKCVLVKNPYIIIGTASPYHCPKCHSTKCPEYISVRDRYEITLKFHYNELIHEKYID